MPRRRSSTRRAGARGDAGALTSPGTAAGPVALVGPTASGKSAVAMAAARAVGGTEIVAVDAMQVYRGMDIGTAKPSPADQADVRHHGIDLVDPSRLHRDRLPGGGRRGAGRHRRPGRPGALVAGTGLYLRVVLDALDPPGQWPEVRAELDAEPDTVALHRRLPSSIRSAPPRMEPGNRRRVVRALEVTLGSGRPFTSFGPGLTRTRRPTSPSSGCAGPARLTERIEQRFAAMIDAGLLDEVERLAAAPGGLSRTAARRSATRSCSPTCGASARWPKRPSSP